MPASRIYDEIVAGLPALSASDDPALSPNNVLAQGRNARQNGLRPRRGQYSVFRGQKIWRIKIYALYLHTRNPKFGRKAQVVKLVDTLL